MGKLEDMEVFVQVMTSGSMSAAGRELGLSPAGVSKRLKRLEEALGTRLLQRTTRQISPTEAGLNYFDRIRPLLAGIEEAENLVARRAETASGTLTVSAPTSFGRMHVAPHINVFMRNYPDVAINLQLSDEFVDLVGEGFDLAIRIGELTDSSLVARKLAGVRRILCAAPDYLTRQGTPDNLGDLADHICLAPHNNDIWKLEGPDGAVTYRPAGPLKTNSSEVIREAVIAGAGIALRSTWDINLELEAGKLVQVLPGYEGTRDIGIYALFASRQFLPAKIRVFIDFLAEIYGPLFSETP